MQDFSKTQSKFYSTARETRTLSLPDALTNFMTSPSGVSTFPSNPFLKPIQPSSTKNAKLFSPRSLLPSTASESLSYRSQPYKRTVKISSEGRTMLYSLRRKEDGSLMEFKPIKSQTHRGEKKTTIQEEKISHKKTASMGPLPMPTPGPGTGAQPSFVLDTEMQAPKSDFFSVVNRMLDDKHRQFSKDREKAMETQNWFMNQQVGSRIKVPITKIKKKLSVDLKMLRAEEREILLEYEHEILGNYTSSENRPRVISSRMQKKLAYLQKLRQHLLDEENKQFIVKMVKARKRIKNHLLDKNLQSVMDELTEVLNMTIEVDDMYSFLETLHVISDTYYDFGELDNSLFAFNQLRIACELCNNKFKKIAAYTGMAEACKRLGYFSQALILLKRALQFAWFIGESNKECQIYDLIGIIYYTQGDIERANYYHARCVDSEVESSNSPLVRLSNGDLVDYMKINHFKFTSIEPAFFAKMSITYRPRRMKAFNAKAKKDKLRSYIHTEGKDEGKSFLETEAKIRRVSVFLEKLITKTQSSQADHYSLNEPSKHISTKLSALSQLDTILAEPDFDRNIASPRTFYSTVEDQNGQPVKQPIVKTESKVPKEKKADKYALKRTKMSSLQYHEMKKDRETYSLKQIFKEKDLTFKSIEDRVELRLHQGNNFNTFEDLKKKFKAQYTAHPINTKMFMGHLTPNRTTYGFLNVIEVKPTRCNNFFDDILEHFVNKT